MLPRTPGHVVQDVFWPSCHVAEDTWPCCQEEEDEKEARTSSSVAILAQALWNGTMTQACLPESCISGALHAPCPCCVAWRAWAERHQDLLAQTLEGYERMRAWADRLADEDEDTDTDESKGEDAWADTHRARARSRFGLTGQGHGQRQAEGRDKGSGKAKGKGEGKGRDKGSGKAKGKGENKGNGKGKAKGQGKKMNNWKFFRLRRRVSRSLRP